MSNGSVGAVEVNPRVEEHIAQLCTNLYVQAEPPRRLAITAAETGEGKTSVGLALAVQTARTLGRKVVFVEANLRSPQAAGLLAVEGRKGLMDVLSGEASVDEAAVSLGERLPDVIVGVEGEDREMIVRRMGRDDLEKLFKTLGERYEHVIVETPAINHFPEAQVVVGLCDRVLLVIRAGRTSREAAAVAVRRIEGAGGKPPLVVLNRKQYHVPGFLYRRL